jgi:hypothetical protein
MSVQYLKLGHERFFSHSFYFIIHLSPFRSKLYILLLSIAYHLKHSGNYEIPAVLTICNAEFCIYGVCVVLTVKNDYVLNWITKEFNLPETQKQLLCRTSLPSR